MSTPTLIGVPYDASSSFLEGAADAPPLIRQALWSPAGNSWSELGIDIEPHLDDAGDVSFEPGCDPREVITAAVAALFDRRRCPIVLGGDHSITYPVMRAVFRALGSVTMLHIDAHPDLYDEFEGDRYSHACPFARIMEERLAGRLTQVGIRAANGHLREQAARFGVDVITMRDWMGGMRPVVREPVYVSIDLDGIDPAFAPGVSHQEPGGLSVRDVIDIIQRLPVPIVGADVVEYNPHQDPTRVTAIVAAKLVKEIVARVVQCVAPAEAG
jgi:arginase